MAEVKIKNVKLENELVGLDYKLILFLIFSEGRECRNFKGQRSHGTKDFVELL